MVLRKYHKVKSQRLDVRGQDGLLWVTKPLFITPFKDYHIADLNLFWVDIRENAKERVAAWLAANPSYMAKEK